MDVLTDSWNAFTNRRAEEYLVTYGHPSPSSKRMLVHLLKALAGDKPLRILDVGCGNGHLCEYFHDNGLDCEYTGVDFSAPLLKVATEKYGQRGRFLAADASTLEGVPGRYDVAVYSHVVEMLASPDASLLAASKLADKIVIRFFEPPDSEFDAAEIDSMDVGDGRIVPYVRRKLSRDYYRLILSKIGCTGVDVYHDAGSKDQIHILHWVAATS